MWTDVAMLVLASTSPRRRHLLTEAGIPFRLTAPGPEPVGAGTPAERARVRARGKAEGAVASGGPVLGVDTVVALGSRELGKPADAAAARDMLEALSGREHEVHTALCLVDRSGGRMLETLETAVVCCAPLGGAALERYLASETWRGKAGAYGIQDPEAEFMTLVRGDRDTVVGLPVRRLRAMLAELEG